MADVEVKETMQNNNEASLGRLKTIKSCHSLGECGNNKKDFPSIKDDKSNSPADSVDSDHSMISEASGTAYLGYPPPFYQQEMLMWPSFCANVMMLQQCNVNTFDNHSYPIKQEHFYPVGNGFQFMPFNVVPQGYPYEVQFQEFDYFVVIDFEATCDKYNNPNPQEIIEFPSVLVNSLTGQLETCFQTYVRPAHHPLLTDFCKELTGIQQSQVDRGVSLSDALFMHDKWLEEKGIKNKNFAVVTWSDWDCKVMLESECRLKGIHKPPYFNRWINLKVPFQEVFGHFRCKLKEAVQLSGLTWEGRAHCGLDDARNTARLLVVLMRGGFHYSITNSMEGPVTCSDGKVDSVHQVEKPKEPAVASREVHPFKSPVFKSPIFKSPVFKSPVFKSPVKEKTVFCFCGVKSSKSVVRKPGPNQGKWFFGCGNWSSSRRASCDYFVWAS